MDTFSQNGNTLIINKMYILLGELAIVSQYIFASLII